MKASRLRTKRTIWPAAAAVIALGGAIVGATLTVADSGVRRVTGADPYAGCTLGGPGYNYPSAEVEPYVAVNPANGNNLIGVWQQDRWTNGGAHGLAAGVSQDGGRSWSTVALPFSTCAPSGQHYTRASDPWVSIGPDGTAYAIAINFDGSTARSGVATATSTDGGRTWHNARELIADDDINVLNDKESITADPVHAGTAYAVWDRVDSSHNNQPSYFSKTSDFGRTWTPARAITSTADNVGVIGDIAVVNARTGILYDFFDNFTLLPNGNVATANESVIKSGDGGATWSQPIAIAADMDIGAFDPFTGAFLRTGSGLPDVAIDQHTGELYVVWEDARFSGGRFDEVALSRSLDGGATWSTPKRVNRETGDAAVSPMVAVGADGTVGVSYYDFRNATQSVDESTLPTNYWLTTSRRGGNAFDTEEAIIGSPFDLKSAASAGGYFVGDYQGLAADGDAFVAFFAEATGTAAEGAEVTNRSDIFAKEIGASSVTSATDALVPAGGSRATSSARAAHAAQLR